MTREHLFHRRAPADPLFRWRGGDVSRIEALSDAAFALTLTLMVTSSAEGMHFAELWNVVVRFPAFALSFLVIALCWHQHHRFFRRYGLEDGKTIALNLALLFTVIFYAYPLQFLSSVVWDLISGGDNRAKFTFHAYPDFPLDLQGSVVALMVFYGAGFMAVFGLFTLLHCRAWRHRDDLDLDALERHLTRAEITTNGIMCGVGALSVILAILTESPAWAGFAYWLLGPLHAMHGSRSRRKTQALHAELLEGATADEAPEAEDPEAPLSA